MEHLNHIDPATGLVSADRMKMVKFRQVLERMRDPHADRKRLEHEMIRCFSEFSREMKSRVINDVTGNILHAADDHNVREALIAYAYQFNN
jgi:hypothetical protein